MGCGFCKGPVWPMRHLCTQLVYVAVGFPDRSISVIDRKGRAGKRWWEDACGNWDLTIPRTPPITSTTSVARSRRMISRSSGGLLPTQSKGSWFRSDTVQELNEPMMSVIPSPYSQTYPNRSISNFGTFQIGQFDFLLIPFSIWGLHPPFIIDNKN